MKEYIIRWNTGYGDTYYCVSAENEEDANTEAYELWRDEAESNADYGVVGEYTEELAEEYL